MLQTIVFVAVCSIGNIGIARLFRVHTNTESAIISALILSVIAGPLALPGQFHVLVFMAVAAMASKYLLVRKKSHIFNPAAFGIVASAIFLDFPASWWIGSSAMTPIILIGGIAILRKIRRWHVIFSFLGTYIGLYVIDALVVQGRSIETVASSLWSIVIVSPLLFFMVVMLVEPLTAPQTSLRRVWFGVCVGGVLFFLQRLLSSVPYSLELSLLVGNGFARWINPDFRQAFILRKKQIIHETLAHFYFRPVRAFSFLPGQFLEYTYAHPHPDARGIRRYFTIASSPTEQDVLLTTRFSVPSSSFKSAMQQLKSGDEIIASKVAGEFLLPSDPHAKIAFIAGGIGITPFRSMVKYLLDMNEKRDIVLLYGARDETDVLFRDIFDLAQKKFEMKTVYVLSRYIDESCIRKELPDHADRLMYISGSEPMVQSTIRTLKQMGVARSRIRRDYFPGYTEQV